MASHERTNRTVTLKKTLVSIIIPCYNAESFVGEAIESALSQTWPHIEVIVIDDGSTDGSLNIIKSFGDRVRWKTGPNRGGCAARNSGLELSQGEFVQFLDADDLIKPEKTRLQMEAMPEPTGWMIPSGRETRTVDSPSVTSSWIPPASPTDPVEYVLRHSLTITPLHARADLVAIGGFRQRLHCAQERDLHLRLACHGIKFRIVKESLYIQRVVSGSVSSNTLAVLLQHEDVFLKVEEILREKKQLTPGRQRALAGAWARDGKYLVGRGDRDSAQRFFEKAKELDPRGISDAFEGKSNWLYRLFGPMLAQQFVAAKRRCFKKESR